jgi:hypothetical protein
MKRGNNIFLTDPDRKFIEENTPVDMTEKHITVLKQN